MICLRCAPLLPGAPAPASRHPSDDRWVPVSASLAASGRRAFPGCPVLGRSQKQQAPGSTVHSAFPGLFELSDRPGLPLPAGRWGATGRPIGGFRGPRALTGWAIRVGQSASRAKGDCRLRTTARRRHTRNSTGKDQRPCSIGMIRCGYGGF